MADVTPVTNNQGKLMPNSNVMYELGRAYGKHNYQRIIVLAAEGDWNVKNMPFDINHSTIIPVDVNNSDYFYHLIKGSVKYAIDSPDTIFSHNDSVLYSDFQIKKNISSGKYLPDVFLEKLDLKEHLRYFADSCLFSSYVSDKVYNMYGELNEID